jgi:hypothetical protein
MWHFNHEVDVTSFGLIIDSGAKQGHPREVSKHGLRSVTDHFNLRKG